MRKQLAAAAATATALIALGAAPTAAHAAPESATAEAQTSTMAPASDHIYHSAHRTESLCKAEANRHNWFAWHCRPDTRDGRTVYELWYIPH